MYLLISDPRVSLFNGRAHLLKYSKQIRVWVRRLASLRGWAGRNKAELKAGEWLVVLIGLTLGAVVLGISPAPIPEVPEIISEPAPASASLGSRMGEEWACTIVEDNQNLVNLVCHRDGVDEESPRFIQSESQLEPVHIAGANP